MIRKAAIITIYVTIFWGLLPAGLWFFGEAMDAALTLPAVPAGLRLVGGVVGALGLAGTCWAMWFLSTRGRGLPISHLPPEKKVSTGPYRWFRHPIYVFFNLAWAGVGLGSGSWGRGVGSTVLLFLAWQAYTRFYEDPALRKRFGARQP